MFLHDGVVHRQVNHTYKEHYDHLIASGLYDALVERGLLIPHVEASVESVSSEAYKVLRPERVPFISYPYEWCFSQWKDAALTTLEIQQTAFEFGMSLKDASAFNIQFVAGRPLLIDTLSLEKYREGTPWIAYRQYCEHFLAPLALMARRDIRLGQLCKNYVDGLPLDLASRLLPSSTWLRPALLIHIHLHAKSQRKYATKKAWPNGGRNKPTGISWFAGQSEIGDFGSELQIEGFGLDRVLFRQQLHRQGLGSQEGACAGFHPGSEAPDDLGSWGERRHVQSPGWGSGQSDDFDRC